MNIHEQVDEVLKDECTCAELPPEVYEDPYPETIPLCDACIRFKEELKCSRSNTT